MSSPLVAPPVVKTQPLNCPNCGGPVEIRGFGHALTVICPQCLSVLDTSTPLVQVITQLVEKLRCDPKIPLGTRGKMGNVTWEVIGFQNRRVHDEDGSSYSWQEYLLFNPYHGFCYLTEYEGHWNFVTPLEAMPVRITVAGQHLGQLRPAVSLDGRKFKHFSGVMAQTSFVLGEFPWRVKVGEKVLCDDFVDPPTVLSSETTDDEITWSRGEYTPGADIWKAFALPGSPPKPAGVFLNQPSPYHGTAGGVWKLFFLMLLAIIVLAIVFSSFGDKTVLDHSYRFSTANQTDPAFVTPVFNLQGRTAGMELTVKTNLSNNWAYFNFALIDDDTGHAYDFGREVSYYYGTDSDGSWTEGGDSVSIYIPAVPPGHYYLRVEPEMDVPKAPPVRASTAKPVKPPPANTVSYELILKHAVPNYTFFWLAVILLLIPPIWHSMRTRSFEVKRWMESDYPPVARGGD